MMKYMARPMAILFLISAVCAGLLGVVESITREPTRIQEELTASNGKRTVMAEASSFVEIEIEDGFVQNGIKVLSADYALDANGDVMGYVIEVAPNGFGGGIGFMVGVDLEGAVTGISILSHSESPGLGARIKEEWFLDQFVGEQSPIAVTKDGGVIESITSSTITSRAVANGVTAACDWVEEYVGGTN